MTDVSLDLDPSQAESVVESLRSGIPPTGHLRTFTVGRSHELDRLEETLQRPEVERGSALLVQANYGGGKTHLLRLIRELALDAGFAVALVTVDSQSAVRFNRMDQVMAAVMRSIEFDAHTGKGVAHLFDAFGRIDEERLDPAPRAIYDRVTSRGRWDFSEEIRSPGLYVALRTWLMAPRLEVRDTIIDWLSHPWDYKSARKRLYEELIYSLPVTIREPRSDAAFYRDGVFVFDGGGHQQAWAALGDLDTLVRLSGRRGLVLLFDEFEDVIQNLKNIKYEQDAFLNLFRLFGGDQFPGMSYFAVTPDFTYKCRERLMERFVYTFPVERFDELECFQMTSITREDFDMLARSIRIVHGLAYGWDSSGGFTDKDLDQEVSELFDKPSADQIRQAVEGLVAALDVRLDD